MAAKSVVPETAWLLRSGAMRPAEPDVMRVLPRLEWRAFYGDQPTGEVKAWVRPDGRCSVFFDSCLPGAYRPLLNAVAASVSRDLYASIDEAAGEDLARYAELGFEVSRREGSYLIPVNPDTTGLRGTQAPAGFGVISAQNADEDRLRLLDDALRQDVPGTDGWQWDAAGFHTETFGGLRSGCLSRRHLSGKRRLRRACPCVEQPGRPTAGPHRRTGPAPPPRPGQGPPGAGVPGSARAGQNRGHRRD
jgi:hypothetical protein